MKQQQPPVKLPNIVVPSQMSMNEGAGCVTMTEESTLIIVGRLAAPYGVKGWQHVDSFTQPCENILKYATWYIGKRNQWKAYSLKTGRPHGKRVVVHLEGINSPEEASLLTQSMIAIPREAMPSLADDEYYWADLEGLTVETAEAKVLGKIDYLYQNVGVDIMVIRTQEDEELQIPFVMTDTVIAVDLTQGKVVVDWVIEQK